MLLTGCWKKNIPTLTAGLGGPRLHETIPDFHNTPKRLEALRKAIAADTHGRAASVRREIDFALARGDDCHRITDLIAAGIIPERVTHNDTKLNNVLLDDSTSEGVCVIDLDRCRNQFAYVAAIEKSLPEMERIVVAKAGQNQESSV